MVPPIPPGRSRRERSYSRLSPYPEPAYSAREEDPLSANSPLPQPLPLPSTPTSSGEELLMSVSSSLYNVPARSVPEENSLPDGSLPPVPQPPTSPEEELRMPVSNQGRLYQLMVRPIIKQTVGQRHTSGNTLEDAVVNGDSFTEILQKLWDHFIPRVKCCALRIDGVWTTEPPEQAAWSNVMLFKVKKHIVDTSKTDLARKQWLVKMRGEIVTLLIYVYGVANTRAQDQDAFKVACIRPEHTDRAGATAEIALRDIFARLQEEWGNTFQGEAGLLLPRILSDLLKMCARCFFE